MQNLFENYSLEKFKVKKKQKNQDRLDLIERISVSTGWNKKSIHFSTLNFPDSWLQDALNHCLHFSNPKLRNMKFKEFINSTKIK